MADAPKKPPSPLSRREVRDEARHLRTKPGWDPAKKAHTSAEEALQELALDGLATSAYAEAGDCAACARARLQSSDPTALCDEHLALALLR